MLLSTIKLSPWLGSENDLALFEEMIEVNMKSYIHIVSHALPHLRKNGSGRIGVLGSQGGRCIFVYNKGIHLLMGKIYGLELLNNKCLRT